MSAPSFTYSGNVYTDASAGSVDFPLTSTEGNAIGYLERSHIHVYKSADQGVTWTEQARPGDWDFVSNGTVARLTAGIAAGEWVKVQRITPSDTSYITFQASSLLTAEQLNDDTLFNTYINQERYDQGEQSAALAAAAITTANQAAAAVSNAVLFDLIANVGAIPASPSDNTYVEVGDSTGIESFTPLVGLPATFTGDAGLTVRLRYTTAGATWNYLSYFANDPETRYEPIGSGGFGYTNWSYTAVGGETALGSTGLGGGALEYQVGKELVFLNGVLLLRDDDYTAEDGVSITLALALAQGDHVSVRCVNYLPSDPGASYSYMRWRKTAAGGETAVGPTGDLSASGYTLTLEYAVNREQVYLNGALLARGGDYAASTGTTITGLAALAAGDVIEVHSINAI